MNYESWNDYEILYLIEENHEDAYSLLVKKYKPLVDQMVRKYLPLGRRYALEYDDLYQAGLLGLYYAVTHYKKKEKAMLFTFLSLCVKGRMLNLIRVSSSKNNEVFSQAISLSSPYPNTTYALEDIVPMSYQVEDELLTDELQNELIYFKHSLDFVPSCVFELKVNGFTSREIGNLLELSPKAVDNFVFQIRKKVKSYLRTKKYI